MMNFKQLGPALLVAAVLFVAVLFATAGCSMFVSEKYQQSRAELELAATAAAAEDWELALQHANLAVDLYPHADAYLCRAKARLNRPLALDDVPLQHRETVLVLLRIDDSIADVKSGLELDPRHQELIALDNQLGSRKRLAEIQKALQAPSLSDVFAESQAFEFSVRGLPSGFEDLNKLLRSRMNEIDEAPPSFPKTPPDVAELLGIEIEP